MDAVALVEQFGSLVISYMVHMLLFLWSY